MIYHYCNAIAFKSIVDTKQIWLTDISKLNDCSEYRSGFDIISEILEDKGLSGNQVLQEIHTNKLNINFQILIGCFSQEGDSGSQWRLYADDSRGLSIGFDENEIHTFTMFNQFIKNGLKPIYPSVNYYPVCYDSSKFVLKVTDLIDSINKDNSTLKYQKMALALRRFSALYKDSYFKDEREIRVIAERNLDWDDNYVLYERVNAYKEKVNYHKLLTSYQHLSAIKEVIIGANCSYTEEDVKSILHENGLEEVAVRYSSGRGRYRTVS